MSWNWYIPLQSPDDRADRSILSAYENQEGTWLERRNTPPHLTRSYLKRLMELGKVTFEGKPIQPNSKLSGDGILKIEFPDEPSNSVPPEPRKLEVLFEDSSIAVINKPVNWTVHPSPHQKSGTLVNALLAQFSNLSTIGGPLRRGIVHRLDKGTSGALIVAKTNAAHLTLIRFFSERKIDKEYEALVFGGMETRDRTYRIESFIGRHPTHRTRMRSFSEESKGKKAITRIHTLNTFTNQTGTVFASHLHVNILTGRTHQIRVHLNDIGHSILGDPTYGEPRKSQKKWMDLPSEVQTIVPSLPSQALHASRIEFPHPITSKKISVQAQRPKPFENLLEILRSSQKRC